MVVDFAGTMSAWLKLKNLLIYLGQTQTYLPYSEPGYQVTGQRNGIRSGGSGHFVANHQGVGSGGGSFNANHQGVGSGGGLFNANHPGVGSFSGHFITNPQGVGSGSGNFVVNHQGVGSDGGHFTAAPHLHSCLQLPNQSELLLPAGCYAPTAANFLCCPDCICHSQMTTTAERSSRQGSRSGSPRSGGSLSPHRTASPAGGGGDLVDGRYPVGRNQLPLLAAGRGGSPGGSSCCPDYDSRYVGGTESSKIRIRNWIQLQI